MKTMGLKYGMYSVECKQTMAIYGAKIGEVLFSSKTMETMELNYGISFRAVKTMGNYGAKIGEL